ncbi:uncharacterized protein J7T54_000756 [Emericellopsis cladophorae]|uniref:Metallo-beta-lactamase domain-containing protein n=1 Tax=Emericellopsis cladophorae TaxID=2686198 RepID=A0A9P9XVR2_9HYPO|nr:uncharacterized protein J7T54_000756 [Emericellopsis cladophorae]KAI6778722.1 hypothetical protein J7T54_000756 [Emericellopsis cladophorae]
MEYPEPYDQSLSSRLLLCTACGTQFPATDRQQIKTCHICDDVRQYVPRSGQSFTTLQAICSSSQGHRNQFEVYEAEERLVFVKTVPQVGIGQRCIIVRTPQGNVLWDCITLLDEATIQRIKDMGGLRAIVISHPHFYTTHVQWARAFACPVYVAAEDASWTTMPSAHRKLITETETDIFGTKVIKMGGHFPGSLVLLWQGRLLIADTILTTPSGLGDWSVNALGEDTTHVPPPPDRNTFTFQWSIPNMIPLSADELLRMWTVLQPYTFTSTHGGFMGQDIEDEGVKGRVLRSMQIQCRYMGGENHPLMKVTL